MRLKTRTYKKNYILLFEEINNFLWILFLLKLWKEIRDCNLKQSLSSPLRIRECPLKEVKFISNVCILYWEIGSKVVKITIQINWLVAKVWMLDIKLKEILAKRGSHPRSCKRSNTMFQKSLLLFSTWREHFYSQPTQFSSQPKK